VSHRHPPTRLRERVGGRASDGGQTTGIRLFRGLGVNPAVAAGEEFTGFTGEERTGFAD